MPTETLVPSAKVMPASSSGGRGKGASQRRKRGGAGVCRPGGDPEQAAEQRKQKLRQRGLQTGQLVHGFDYSLERQGSCSTTGWQGADPPQLARETVQELYSSGLINDYVAKFYPVRYATAPR